MNRYPLVCFLFFLCVLMYATSALAAVNPTRLSAVEQSKAEAATLLQQGKPAEAYALYSALLREAPSDDDVNLGLARAALGANRPNQALMAYLRLLEKYPNQPQLHAEIAQTYMALGDKEKAGQHLRRNPELSGTQADNTLNALEKRYDRLQVHGALRAGLLYDTNANQGPASSTMDLGLWSNVYLAGSKAKESAGAYLGAQVDVGYRLEQAGTWWLVGDAQAYARGNANNSLDENTSRTWEWGRMAAGMRFLDSRNLFDVRVKTEVFDYELNRHVLAAGPELLYVRAVRPDIQLISRGSVEWRDYPGNTQRNGSYYTAGQYVRLFFGEANHEVLVGGRYVGATADQTDYSYDGWETSARVAIKLPHGFELIPQVSYGAEYYKGPATALETKKRNDERLRTGLGMTYQLSENWSLETAWQYTNNISSSKLYEYDQHLFTMGAAWTF